jgi:hypothetical protein
VRSVVPRIEYDARTRYVRGGALHLTMESGEKRLIEVEALGESGFLLKTAGYGSWAGHIHGAWRGRLKLDGEYIADGSDDEHLRLLGQFHDTPVRPRGRRHRLWHPRGIISGVCPTSGSAPNPTTGSRTPDEHEVR